MKRHGKSIPAKSLIAKFWIRVYGGIAIGNKKTNPIQGEKMFKKMLFVFVLAAAVLAFAGFGVPMAAAACSASVTSCNSMFGPNFQTTLTVVSPIASPLANVNTEDSWTEIGELGPQELLPVEPECLAGQPGAHGCQQ